MFLLVMSSSFLFPFQNPLLRRTFSKSSCVYQVLRSFSQVQAKNEKKSEPKEDIESAINESLSRLLKKNQVKDEYKFTIYGEPQALQRHRTTRHGINYNPSAKDQVHFSMLSIPHLPPIPIDGPMEAELVFYFSRPKNHYRTGKNSHMLKETSPLWKRSKPDLDNLIKFVLDSLNDKAYLDDSQIVHISAKKLYTNTEPRTEILFRSANSDFSLVDEYVAESDLPLSTKTKE